MAEENVDVIEEIQNEEIVQPQDDSAEAGLSHESNDSSDQRELSDKEINFQKMREAVKRLEEENHNLKESQKSTKAPPPPIEEYKNLVDDDDLVEGKIVNQLDQKIKKLEETLERDRLSSIPDKLTNKYADFNQVVTEENMKKLQSSEPEMYQTILAGSDLYVKSVSAYKALKNFGIVEDETMKSQKEQVLKNHSKPLSTQAIKGQGAMSSANLFANGLTPELKKQLQMEMVQSLKAR